MTTSTADLHRAALNLVDLVDAAAELAAVLGDSMTAMHVGGAFSCTEAERLADVLRAVGQHAAAETWLDGHAEGSDTRDGDTDPEDHHHGRHLRGRIIDRYHALILRAHDAGTIDRDELGRRWTAARARLADAERFADGRDWDARYEYPSAAVAA